MDQFVFAFRAERIDRNRPGHEIRDAQLLAHLAPQGFGDRLAVVHMAAHGRVPPSGLNVLPGGAFLQIEFAARIENMEVHHRVQEHRPAVALAARGFADDVPRRVDHGKDLFAVIAVHAGDIYGCRSWRPSSPAARKPRREAPYIHSQARARSAGRRRRPPGRCPG